MKRLPVACGLCGRVNVAPPGVASRDNPHYCIADIVRAHARIVIRNAWIRAERAATARFEYQPEHDETPDTGIRDLCAWGDYHYCMRVGAPPRDADRRIAKRVDARLLLVEPHHVGVLWGAYVSRGETDRERGRPTVGRPPKGVARLSKAVGAAEDAYLEAVCRKCA